MRKMDNPTISTCLIVYNQADYVRDCIDGALMQKTDYAYEIVIGDDCSTDRTSEICKKYAEEYPNLIRYFRREKNLGMIGNWAETIKNCNGKYIALCEGDDYWTDPLKLQKQVDFLEANEGVVITGHDAFIINEKGVKIKESKLPEQYKKDAKGRELKEIYWILTLTMVFRNIPEVIYDLKKITNSPNGDSCLISLLGNYGDFYYHNEIEPAAYRVHAGGVWSMLEEDKKMDNHFITLNELLKFYVYKNDIEMIEYYKQKIDQNIIKQFDYAMNTNSFLMKTKVFSNTLLKSRNWQKKDRFFYLIKSYIKSIITK